MFEEMSLGAVKLLILIFWIGIASIKRHISRGHPDKNSFKEAQKTIVAEQNPTIALQQSLHLLLFSEAYDVHAK